MGNVAENRALIKRVMLEYEHLYNLEPTEGVQTTVIFDESRDHYLLLTLGWEGNRREYRIVLHVRLFNERFWIEEDWTENGIATDLLLAEIPNTQIVLAMHAPDRRKWTEFAHV